VLAVRNCCYVVACSAAQGALAPTGEERDGGILWRPPAYSLLVFILDCRTFMREILLNIQSQRLME